MKVLTDLYREQRKISFSKASVSARDANDYTFITLLAAVKNNKKKKVKHILGKITPILVSVQEEMISGPIFKVLKSATVKIM